jgi:xylan 1,4-beta-xylosidase
MYENPVVRGMNPDPTICRAGEDYYLATSTMYLYPGVPIYHSRDLVNWRLIGHALTRPEHFQPERTAGAHDIYAPTLRFHDGTFYMITTNVRGGGNFFVAATDPAGPWSDPIFVDADVFDPSLLFDRDGKVYYSRRGAMHDKDVVQAEIDITTGELLGPVRSIGVGMVSDDAEGPHIYHIGDWYYLLNAEGGSRFLHMATIGRSRSVWGPFEPCPHNPIIAQHNAWWHTVRSAGHADLVDAADGSWWAVFLATRHASYDGLTVLGRETFLAPVRWVDEWPVVNVQAMRELMVDALTLPLHPWPAEPVRDDFDAMTFGLAWAFLACPDAPRFSLSDRPGFLRIRGADAPFAGSQSTFAGKRQTEFVFEANTQLEFDPTGDGEEAGLSVFHREEYHYDLYVTRRGGSRVVVLRKTVGDIVVEAALPIENGSVRLRVVGDAGKYTFSFSVGADLFRVAGTGLTQLLAAEVVGSWNGMLIGVFAAGNGQPEASAADFDYFEYRDAEALENRGTEG